MADPIKNARQTADAKKVLLEQAKAIGLTVDPKWDVDDLALHVMEAQDAVKEAAKAAFEAAPKQDVFLLRDAWPVEDERHDAGETISVPDEMAKRWFVAGVARPA